MYDLVYMYFGFFYFSFDTNCLFKSQSFFMYNNNSISIFKRFIRFLKVSYLFFYADLFGFVGSITYAKRVWFK